MQDYELIEHTADIGVRIKGKDLREIFTNAADAMFDIIVEFCTDCNKLEPKEFNIEISAENIEELIVNWLNELLSLSEAKNLIFNRFLFKSLSENHLMSVASGYPREKYKIKTEIKAATYHELRIEKTEKGFQAEVIFDV